MNKSLRQRFGISMLALAVLVASMDNVALRAFPDLPQQRVPATVAADLNEVL